MQLVNCRQLSLAGEEQGMRWESVRWRPRRSARSPRWRCGHHDPAPLSQKDLVGASGTPSTSNAAELRHSRHSSHHQHSGTRQLLSCFSQSGHFNLLIKVLWSSNNTHAGFLPFVSRFVASSPSYTHTPPSVEGCSSCHPLRLLWLPSYSRELWVRQVQFSSNNYNHTRVNQE